jgi:hypothetical protein
MPSTVYICQGCHKPEPDFGKLAERGIVEERLYCEDCIKVVDAFLSDRDDLHTQLARLWSEGLATLVSDYSVDIKALPDS